MRIIDLTHTLTPGMPVYPGTEPPVFQQANTLEKDGFVEMKITMYSHTGTHMDAPYHILKDGLSLDRQSIDRFMGSAVILDLKNMKSDLIEVEVLQKFEQSIRRVDFVILNTGWDKYWGSDAYFKDFPSLSPEAAKWLASFQLKGVGIDAISVDSIRSTRLEVHRILFEKNINVIENLANLDAIGQEIFTFCCMPLKTVDADGSTVRAFGIEGERQVIPCKS